MFTSIEDDGIIIGEVTTHWLAGAVIAQLRAFGIYAERSYLHANDIGGVWGISINRSDVNKLYDLGEIV